jgi:RNA polymerase sigma-70 factor (ECF subfamily)
LGSMVTRTDEVLLQAALDGAQEAWCELVDRYHARGIRFIRRQLNDPYLAEDIMQNLWVAIVGAVRQQAPSSFAGLFWTLLKRRIIDELRRRGRSREAAVLDAPTAAEGQTLLQVQADSGPEPEEQALASEAQTVLLTALDRLPDHYRLVIQARQLEGRSNRETARLLIKEGLVPDEPGAEKRVENYYYRGLKELRRQLEALHFFEGGSPQ